MFKPWQLGALRAFLTYGGPSGGALCWVNCMFPADWLTRPDIHEYVPSWLVLPQPLEGVPPSRWKIDTVMHSTISLPEVGHLLTQKQ